MKVEITAEGLDLELRPIAVKNQAVGVLAGNVRADFEHVAEAPETEEPDAVLPLGHQLVSLSR